MRVADKADLGAAADGEELRTVGLEDTAAMNDLLEGVDAVVHFGGVMTDKPWDAVLQSNIIGVYNLYEAARRHGVRRVVYASSNHATGFYRQDEVITPRDPVRPDSLYGASKTWGESLSRFYFDRHGIETACLRIGSATSEPKDRRMLATWLSYGDLGRLVRASLIAPRVGHTIAFGAPDNPVKWWDNGSAGHLGFRPQDSAEAFRGVLEAIGPAPDPGDPANIYQGGFFVRLDPPDQ